MSMGSEGSTVSGDRSVPPDPRFQTAVHNISRLFDRITAIEDELTQSQKVISQRAPDEVWSESSHPREPAPDRRFMTTILPPKPQIQGRSKSLPESLLTSTNLDNFQMMDEIERRRFIELELERQRERARAAARPIPKRTLSPCLQQISERGRLSEVKAELTVAREEAKNLIRVNAELRKRNNMLSSQNEALESKFDKLKNRHNVLRSENARLAEALKSAAHQQSQEAVNARESVRQAEARHAGTRAELWGANQQLNELRKRNESLQSELTVARKENENLQERVKTLELEKDITVNDIHTMENRVRCLERVKPDPSRTHSDTVLLQLVDQLAQAREDAVSARAEIEKQKMEFEDFRKQCTTALHRERINRRKAIESECLSLLSSTGLMTQTLQQEPVQESTNRSEKTYLKRIRSLQDTVNNLNEKIAEFERRELSRAPVVLRSRSGQRKAKKTPTQLPHITRGYPAVLTSFLCDDDEEEERSGPVPTETDHTGELTSN